jgi:hypothetical protein
MSGVNLFMAMFWLTVAVGVFVLSGSESGLPQRFSGSGLVVGWLALAFCAYNLVRWLITRMMVQRKRPARPPRRLRTGEDAGPNPAFDFSDRPPAANEGAGPGR